MRVDPSDYQQLDLRAHALLADVPLHDVWAADLEGGGPDRSVLELRELMSLDEIARVSRPVRLLFGLRRWLGRVFAWDAKASESGRAEPLPGSYLERLSEADRAGTLLEPGSREGAFLVLFASESEVISEIQNATVHAFSVFALSPRPTGHRLHWAIYVQPVGGITRWYMALIDPFRRFIVYPTVLRHVQRAWAERYPEPAGGGGSGFP